MTIPEKLTNAPVSRQRLRLVGAAGEAVEHGVLGGALGGEHVERVVPGVAAVDDQWQVELMGELDLFGEGLALDVTWRVLVVVVEAGLADRHHPWLVEQVDDGVDALAGVVRVQAHGCPDVVELGGGGDRGQAGGAVTSDRHHPGHELVAGGPDRGGGASGHPLVVDVAVRVEESGRHGVR